MSTDTAPDTSSLEDLFRAAVKAHSEGDQEAARRDYALLRELAPDSADVWHLSGVFEAQHGSQELGEAWILHAIELEPDKSSYHNNLGNVYTGWDRFDDAEKAYRRAVELNPERYDAMNNLGLLNRLRGNEKQAEAIYLELLEKVPGYTDARQNLVSLYVRAGRMNEAMKHAATGLIVAPRNTLLRRMLGRAYVDFGVPQKAVELYEKWHEEDPAHPEPIHHLAALRGQDIPDRASDGYVRTTFEGFAASFDARLAELDYQAPALIGASVAEVCGPPSPTLRVFDAGCGTGLCVPFVKPYARQLVGVDLTVEMLKRAAVRGGYDELVHGELLAFLDSRPAACELLVSADTLCYFGRLDDFASVASRSLVAGGWLAFTVESHDDLEGQPDFRLHHHGRYSHRSSYVQRVLETAGFGRVSLVECILRKEHGEPVHGLVVRAQLPAEGQRHG